MVGEVIGDAMLLLSGIGELRLPCHKNSVLAFSMRYVYADQARLPKRDACGLHLIDLQGFRLLVSVPYHHGKPFALNLGFDYKIARYKMGRRPAPYRPVTSSRNDMKAMQDDIAYQRAQEAAEIEAGIVQARRSIGMPWSRYSMQRAARMRKQKEHN